MNKKTNVIKEVKSKQQLNEELEKAKQHLTETIRESFKYIPMVRIEDLTQEELDDWTY